MAYYPLSTDTRTRYWNDGPNVDRFRALVPSLRACRTKLIRHYGNRGTSLVGFLPVVSEASAIMADFSGVFEQLIKLKIPLADAKRYMDESDRGIRFCVGYLSAFEQRARGGHLRRARSRNLVEITWQSVKIGEEDGV